MKILSTIDNYLNKTPMYKLVFQILTVISIATFIESLFSVVSFSILQMLISLVTILIICVGLNFIMSKILKLPLQYESSLITALILYLVLSPVDSAIMFYSVIIASVLATLSKYILVYKKTHFFNPAGLGIYAVTAIGLGSAFWWVGNIYLLPLVLIGGILVIRKTRRHVMFFASLISSFVILFISSLVYNQNILTVINNNYISGPMIFFICIMVTEPHTIATNRKQQIIYGIISVTLIPALMLLGVNKIIPLDMSLGLLVANIISFIFSHRARLDLKLKEIKKLSEDMFEYVFDLKHNFTAGQYMEWVLDHKNFDDRGSRRYYTISSAPGQDISFATKFPPADASTYKKALKELQIGGEMFATQLGGDFILPTDKNIPLAFIAGGIGITPFISQLRDLINKNEIRNIVLFYCVKFHRDIVYLDLLKEAADKLNTKIVFVISEKEEIQNIEYKNFSYEAGFLSMEILKKSIPGMTQTQYFISGPNVMVNMLFKILKSANVKNTFIHTDYFPGF